MKGDTSNAVWRERDLASLEFIQDGPADTLASPEAVAVDEELQAMAGLVGACEMRVERDTTETVDAQPAANPVPWRTHFTGVWDIITSGAAQETRTVAAANGHEAKPTGSSESAAQEPAKAVYHHVPGKVKGYPIKKFRPNPHPFDSEW